MSRFWRATRAVAIKECLHMVRDRFTLALLFMVPLSQLLLFGFAIDLHPQQMPTALLAHERNALVERAVTALEQLGYFKVVLRTDDAQRAQRWLAQSRIQFVLALPPQFAEQQLRGERPLVTLTADATDPIAAMNALRAVQLRYAGAPSASLPIQLQTRLVYNADGASRRFILPGLLGVILTLTLVLLGALSLVREREQGTLETLASLVMPRGAVLLGKTIPYFLMGCVLFAVLLAVCIALLGLSLATPWTLFGITCLFILANLMLGIMLSLIAHNAMQAMQLGIFFYLPSMLLSGFMFPFYGMPKWAQGLGELLPLTHFLRVVRGLLLKDLSSGDAWRLVWPIALFGILVSGIALLLYRQHGIASANRRTLETTE